MQTEKKTAVGSLPSARPTDTGAKDGGKVRLGGQSPSLPPVRAPSRAMADQGKVRLGGQTPAL